MGNIKKKKKRREGGRKKEETRKGRRESERKPGVFLGVEIFSQPPIIM